MNKFTLYLGIIILISSILLAIYGVFRGWMFFGLFLFPVIFGSGLFSALIALLMILAMFLIFFSFLQDEETKTDFGGALLIGPIPIVFGTSGRTILLAMILLLLFLIFILLIFL